MPQIPHSKIPDETSSVVNDGYQFISKRCEQYNADLFETRIMSKKTICMQGQEAAKLFYDEDHFERKGVAPDMIKSTLFGHGGVQGMDGEAHRHRKQMFMKLMSEENIHYLGELAADQWRFYGDKWEQKDRIILFYEVQELICRAVCFWTGVPLDSSEVQQRTKDLAALIDGAGSIGPRHWKGRLARNRAEKWISDLINQGRNEKIEVAEDSALYAVAHHRNLKGELLDKNVAAVEILNILRPTVAVSRFITFAALALHQHPRYKEKLVTSDEEFLRLFVHEVRRFYPFFPFVMARVKKNFSWKGYPFPKGQQVLLDLYGTNHDERIWDNPDQFNPERFRHWDGGAFNFIPLGGDSHYQNHRCAGELPTIKLIEVSVKFLVNHLRYNVPDQNLNLNLSRIPAIPHSRFILSDVKHVTPSKRKSPVTKNEKNI